MIATSLTALILFLAASLLCVCFPGAFGWIERLGAKLATRKRAAILAIAAAAILVRVSLLWLMPVPLPEVEDEFSYLLAADTFVHGRLANPPHAMSLYFDTFHVNQHPTYASMYPPAQGAALAVGELLGNPWIGVLLSMGVMCAAALWALQGWLPPRWALVGGVLVLFRLAISSYWINSYWGGAVAAIGGALVIGALPRIMRFHRARDAVILGVGASILANSRPFEGLIFCLPVFAVLLVWLFRQASPPWRVSIAEVVAPFCAVMLLCGLFMGYYNWRVTGHPLVFPHLLNEAHYAAVPLFAWQKTRPLFHFQNPQFEASYNHWWAEQAWSRGRPDSFKNIFATLRSYGRVLAIFFAWPELFIPALAAPWVIWDRRTRFLVVQFSICLGGFVLVAWFAPHFAAALTATIFILVTQGMRHIRHWRLRGHAFGTFLSRAVVVWAILLSGLHGYYLRFNPSLDVRAQIAKQLDSSPGNDLVIVQYLPDHNPGAEWVYNAADIDHAKVVWARDIPGVSLQPLLDYFHGRRVWILQADANPPKLSRFTGEPAP
ncbi:MAG TPA: hypothetical protein VMJ93_18065 [Verrucomicrobiae bacterium]|nr:hypothetical protein [Verrucomicrobiae bacterium]